MEDHSYDGAEIEYRDPRGTVGRNAVDDLEVVGWLSAIGEGEADDPLGFSSSTGEHLDSEIPPEETGGYFEELAGNVDPTEVDSYEISYEISLEWD